MTKTQRAPSTARGNPRADEAKQSTAPQQGQDAALFTTFEDLDAQLGINDEAGAGASQFNPQERHGLRDSVSGYTDERPVKSPTEGAGYPAYPLDDGVDLTEIARQLPHIAPREGYVNAWISWFAPDGSIERTLQGMMKRGWTPVPIGEISAQDAMFLQTRKGFDTDVYSSSGMVLCEMPVSRHERIIEAEAELHRRNEQATLDEAHQANRYGQKRGVGMRIETAESDT